MFHRGELRAPLFFGTLNLPASWSAPFLSIGIPRRFSLNKVIHIVAAAAFALLSMAWRSVGTDAGEHDRG